MQVHYRAHGGIAGHVVQGEVQRVIEQVRGRQIVGPGDLDRHVGACFDGGAGISAVIAPYTGERQVGVEFLVELRHPDLVLRGGGQGRGNGQGVQEGRQDGWLPEGLAQVQLPWQQARARDCPEFEKLPSAVFHDYSSWLEEPQMEWCRFCLGSLSSVAAGCLDAACHGR